MHFGLGVGFLRGEQMLQGQLNNANLYTAEFGTELALDLNMELQMSDTGSTGAGALHGFGMSTDLFLRVCRCRMGIGIRRHS